MRFWYNLSFIDFELLPDLCVRAEQLGFEGVALSEHLVTFETQYNRYLYNDDGQVYWSPETHWPDNWVAFAALAQHTTTLKFMNSVLILPLRDPFTVAKSASTAARMSGDRVMMAVGVGWQKAEFDMLGQRFDNRGKRADEMLEIIPRLMSGEMTEYHGEYYDFPPAQMSPGVTKPVPILIGGASRAALARAARNDGWFGTLQQTAEVPAVVDTLRAERRRQGKSPDDPFEIIVAVTDLTSPGVRQLEDIGVTMVSAVTPAVTDSGFRVVDAPTAIGHMERFAEQFMR